MRIFIPEIFQACFDLEPIYLYSWQSIKEIMLSGKGQFLVTDEFLHLFQALHSQLSAIFF